MKYADLIERVEKASGPDREIDWLIACGLDHDHMREYAEAWEGDSVTRYARIPGKELATIDTDSGERRTTSIKPDYYSSSLDAAIGLVERVLPPPGYHVRSIGQDDHWNWIAAIGEGYPSNHRRVFRSKSDPGSPNPALAVLSALLRALLSRIQKDTNDG
jgi:hypothetical protein